ncbi:MAG: hypothetical protein ACRERC_26855 [Candidatus Binatia bacterium]
MVDSVPAERSLPRNTIFALLVIGVVPTVLHLLLSRYGFSPTDDGFVLAAARRVVDGQLPHRDFISVRPALSAWLHAPEILLGGAYTYWLSRWFVCLQLGAIAWAWVRTAEQLHERPLPLPERLGLAVLALILTLHTFPLMAWPSIDAMFLASLGLCAVASRRPRLMWVGYAGLGASALCRQNFGLVPLFALVLFGDWRQLRYVVAAGVAGATYVAVMAIEGALFDMLHQVTAAGSVRERGLDPYILNPLVPWGVLGGFLALELLSAGSRAGPARRRSTLWRSVGAAAVLAMMLRMTMALRPGQNYVFGASFLLFAFVLGAVLSMWLRRQPSDAPLLRLGALVLMVGWSVGLSIGWTSPALASGALAVFLWFLWRARVEDLLVASGVPALLRYASIAALAAFAVFNGYAARTRAIYREPALAKITAPLGGVLPGGELLETNQRTHAFLSDLKHAVDDIEASGKRYAIVPDVAGWWASAAQPNPIAVDWAFPMETPSPELQAQLTRSLDEKRGQLIALVQKVRADLLRKRFEPLDSSYSKLLEHVRTRWNKTGETRYFDLYE